MMSVDEKKGLESSFFCNNRLELFNFYDRYELMRLLTFHAFPTEPLNNVELQTIRKGYFSKYHDIKSSMKQEEKVKSMSNKKSTDTFKSASNCLSSLFE